MQSLGMQARVSEGRCPRFMLEEGIVDDAATVHWHQTFGDEKDVGGLGMLRHMLCGSVTLGIYCVVSHRQSRSKRHKISRALRDAEPRESLLDYRSSLNGFERTQ